MFAKRVISLGVVMEAINSFHGKKTMVIIAHRLNTIEKCDIIYKVEGGKICTDYAVGDRF